MSGCPRKPVPRLLFVTWTVLGFSTYAQEISSYANLRDDVETTHVTLQLKGIQRLLATSRVHGRGVLHHAARHRRALRESYSASLRALLETGAFTAAHFTSTSLGDLVRSAAPSIPYSVGLDTTAVLRGDGQAANRWLRRCDSEFYRQAAFLAPMSQQAFDSLERDFEIAPDHLLLTPPAIDTELFDSDTPRASPPRLLFIGNDWRRKGGPALLEWHQQDLADRCELHIVGDVAIPTRNVRGVVLHGPVPRARLARELLPSATALVLPSRLEMTPWVVVEASAAGVPVIASDVGAVGEMVRDGDTGFLLRPDHAKEDFVRAVEALLADPSQCERMGRAAQANARITHSRELVLGRLFDRLMSL